MMCSDADTIEWNHWKSRIEIGVPSLDDQHRSLIRIACAFDPDGPADERKRVLIELMRYTREHFGAEEMLMREAGYADLETHRRAHDDLLAELVDFSERNLSVEEVGEAFHGFVRGWLFAHILRHDARFAVFLRESPKGAPPREERSFPGSEAVA